MKQTTKRIMIVEPDSLISMDLCLTVGNLGYEVSSHVSNGEDALEKALEEKPELVITELTLKGRMDGVELAERLRDELKVPVLFLTADEQAVRNRQPKGVSWICLGKPFDKDELKTGIKTIFERGGGGVAYLPCPSTLQMQPDSGTGLTAW